MGASGKPVGQDCIRCGWCCTFYSVVIVKDPRKGLVEGNLTVHFGGGKRCPHLRGTKPGKMKCAIHNKPWYKKTPCYQHVTLGRPGTPCRMGKYVISKGELPL